MNVPLTLSTAALVLGTVADLWTTRRALRSGRFRETFPPLRFAYWMAWKVYLWASGSFVLVRPRNPLAVPRIAVYLTILASSALVLAGWYPLVYTNTLASFWPGIAAFGVGHWIAAGWNAYQWRKR